MFEKTTNGSNNASLPNRLVMPEAMRGGTGAWNSKNDGSRKCVSSLILEKKHVAIKASFKRPLQSRAFPQTPVQLTRRHPLILIALTWQLGPRDLGEKEEKEGICCRPYFIHIFHFLEPPS